MVDSLSPRSRSLRRVRFAWLTRAAAFFCCAYRIFPAVRSSSRADARRPIHHDRTSAFTAARTWHTVSPGFFPPQALLLPAAEQVRQRRQPLVAQQALVAPPLVVVEAQLRLLVLEAPLLAPP